MKTKILIVILLCIAIQVTSVSYAETKKDAANMQMNLADVELATLARFVSETTGKNFIFDERLKGKVTIITPTNLSSADSFNLFTSVLELKGFTVIPSGVNAYKIIPAVEAKQRGLQIDPSKTPVNESYIARLIPMKNISAEDALKFLQPLISRDGHISTFGPGNLIFVVDSGLNIEKVLKIIEDIDKQSTREEPEIVFLKHSSADVVSKLINDGSSRKTRSAAQGYAEETKAVPDTRLNAVVLFGDRAARESMKALIALLDVPSFEAQGRINVYFLENADAVEIAKVLEGIIKGAQPQKIAGSAPMTAFEAAGGITITADKYTNSLVIVASPTDYQNISQVVKQLDKRRRQVFVEAMIAEVSMDKLLKLGSTWRGTILKDGNPIVVGGVGKVDQATIGNIISGLEGLTMGGLARVFDVQQSFLDPGKTGTFKAPGLAAIFNLSDFRGVVNVLSTPQLLTSDNKEAEIHVGENVPFISKRGAAPVTASYIPTTTIERQDVGIKLKITPQITEGDYVKLDIYQEISALTNESENILINIGPTITKRATKTSVVVKDKQTVVIGGLLQEKDEDVITKVPILGDIPILGYLFKNKRVGKTKTNLLVFLTPGVVKDSDTLARITREKQKESSKFENRYAAGELIVKFREDISADIAKAVISGNGASVIKYIEDLGVYQIKLREGQSVEDGKKLFSELKEVLFAEPNFMIRIK